MWLPELRTVPAPLFRPRSILCAGGRSSQPCEAESGQQLFLWSGFRTIISSGCQEQDSSLSVQCADCRVGGGPDPPAFCDSWSCPHALQPQRFVASGLELGDDLLSSAPAGFQFRTILSFHVFSVASSCICSHQTRLLAILITSPTFLLVSLICCSSWRKCALVCVCVCVCVCVYMCTQRAL